MSASIAPGGLWLVAAAVLFWVAWAFMPGVGITDAALIFERVGASRGQVLASAVLQLVSAACYAPALVALAVARPALRRGATLLLVGAMGSAADAIFHLFAYEMTAPGVPSAALLPVMTRMQGPGLVWILPLIACFFAGSVVLFLGARRAGPVPGAGALWAALAVVVALLFASAAVGALLPGRAVGLSVLALVSTLQIRAVLAPAEG
jgi:hypothetical protein